LEFWGILEASVGIKHDEGCSELGVVRKKAERRNI
jgi:hypothetical protein